ncbi:hypothetical protein [Jatrophihabitans lederbergiae]|uniref:LPXTG cell wall anchor domain-containing protein n=1 Tax=Jatrophihabitans lederbergiae TaxID=3075547 RepID=A0ABU2JAR1_9ACTN|nr:hypothetical protein [Jatrophihabitans sp. DSM 44399]MDT0262077.1 hypothetical protein [Jatrophihabitans sp. DSM 44399]
MAARIRRLTASVAAVVGLLLGALAFAASANAAPYTNQATISVSTQNPAVGGSLAISGDGFAAGETVSLTLHTQTYNLGSATTDVSGRFTATVTLPAGVSGAHTIVATGLSSGQTTSITITIGSSVSSSGGLPNTGVAVLGVGVVGAALLIGGAAMLVVGQRRSASA